ncbi:MAG TPA: hypothetical protein VJ064_08485, partial [Limnochordia bacterium]|nr:hypothetical protein [Limnochordia bacterium]
MYFLELIKINYHYDLTTGAFWALVEIIILIVFYTHSDRAEAGATAGLSLRQAISYVWLGQCLFVLQPMSIDSEI